MPPWRPASRGSLPTLRLRCRVSLAPRWRTCSDPAISKLRCAEWDCGPIGQLGGAAARSRTPAPFRSARRADHACPRQQDAGHLQRASRDGGRPVDLAHGLGTFGSMLRLSLNIVISGAIMPPSPLLRFRVLLSLLACVVANPSITSASDTYRFEISPAGQLDTALDEFRRSTGARVLVPEGATLDGLSSGGVGASTQPTRR